MRKIIYVILIICIAIIGYLYNELRIQKEKNNICNIEKEYLRMDKYYEEQKHLSMLVLMAEAELIYKNTIRDGVRMKYTDYQNIVSETTEKIDELLLSESISFTIDEGKSIKEVQRDFELWKEKRYLLHKKMDAIIQTAIKQVKSLNK